MGNDVSNLLLSLTLLFAMIFFAGRIIAIKIDRDPIMNRTKPGTPEHKAFKEFRASKRINVIIAFSLFAVLLLTIYSVREINKLITLNTPDARFALVFAPIAALVIGVVFVILSYNMLIKKR